MALVADLRMRVHMRHAYALLVEGCPFLFVDEVELTTGWWTIDDRRVLPGLAVPKNLKISLELESGLIEEDAATFQLLDIDGTIPGFFGGLSKPFQSLGQRVFAGSDPIVAPLIADDGNSIPADEGGYLGTEAISEDGARNHYSHIPWADMPGQDHPYHDEPHPVFTTRATGPLLVEGRRVALYRIVYDLDNNAWWDLGQIVTEALANNFSPCLWWGTLRQAGKVDGRIWSITCAGPGSWIRRSLANRMPTVWFPVSADVTFTAAERKVIIDFYKSEINAEDHWYGHDALTYSIPDGDAVAVANYLAAAINVVKDAAGDAGVWTDDVPIAGAACFVSFGLDGCTISTQKNCGFSGRMHLKLHLRVWRLLGYDPLFETNSLDGPQPVWINGQNNYWVGIFTTTPAGKDPVAQDGTTEWDGDGVPRSFTPLYPGGGVSVLSGLGDQTIRLGTENNSPIYLESQLIRPASVGEIDGDDCDSMRWWVFKGPIQVEGQDEPETTYQIARCAWVDRDDGFVGDDVNGISRALRIEDWWSPKLFGLNYEPIDKFTGWASNNGAVDLENQVQASPLSVFGVFNGRADHAHHTLIRVLCSTGTGSWSVADASDDGIVQHAGLFFAEGANSTGLPYPAQDSELFDLSLQYPVDMLDLPSFDDAAEDLPSGSSGALALGKAAIQGGSIQSEELLQALLAPRGWCFSLKRGRLGIWAPHMGSEGKFQEGVDFEITDSDLHGTAGDPASAIPSVELRPVFPFDRIALSYTGNPCESWLEGQNGYKAKARDAGARARSGTRTRDVQGPDLISREWFAGDESGKTDPAWVKSWRSDFSTMWERKVAGWLSQPHRKIEGLRISRPTGQDIYPGCILRLTNPWPANSDGGYGVVGAYVRVTSVTIETDSCAVVVDGLLEAQAPNALRWAPVLRVVDDVADSDDRYDASERKFFVMAWGGSAPPLSAFIKPASLNAPDEPAKVLGLQYDGHEWHQLFNFYAESVDTVGNSITHTASDGLVGNFFSRMYTLLVLAPSSDPDQADWVRALYAQHTDLPPDFSIPKLPI